MSPLARPPPLAAPIPGAGAGHREWALASHSATKEEMSRLRKAVEQAGMPRASGFLSESQFAAAAHVVYNASKAAATRLLRAFGGAASVEEGKDRCSCLTNATVAEASFFLDETGLLAMLSHGIMVGAVACPGDVACTAGDLLSAELVAEMRARRVARQVMEANNNFTGTNGTTIASHIQIALQGLACLGFSGGRTHLHVALSRGDLELAAWALDLLGPGAWQCQDAWGRRPLDMARAEVEGQLAAARGPLEWALQRLGPSAVGEVAQDHAPNASTVVS